MGSTSSLRVKRLIWATSIHARALSIVASKSLARRRQWPSQAKVRSTTHRRAMSTKPLAAFGRLTISTVQSPLSRKGLLEFGAGVSAVGEDVAQPRIDRADRRQDERSAVAILDVGGMDDDADEMALRVGDDVPLATHDLLAGVESARTAAFTGFRGLAVDHAGCRAGLAAILLSRRHDQGVIDRLPTSLVAPGVEIPLHRRIGREILWQLSPLAAGRGDIQDRVQDIAKLDLPRSSQRRARRQMRGH